jgi:hypothetical protein
MSEQRQDEQEGFLSRWSRRKTLARKGEALEEPSADAGLEPAPQEARAEAEVAPPEQAESRQLREGDAAPAEAAEELPPLESLSEDSDYSAFMREGVPAELKQDALRKLFHSPKFNIRDGLDDYDLDFSNPEPLGDIVTAEMRYRIERELERLAGLDEEEEIPEDAPAVAAADTAEHDQADEQPDPETDDERSESS